jgi:hypothetical protein
MLPYENATSGKAAIDGMQKILEHWLERKGIAAMTEAHRVWIAQCLCPQRHAILAAAAVAEDEADAQETIVKPLRTQITDLVRIGALNPWCGLCHAPIDDWRYEVGRTPFRSMEEGTSSLRQSEREQAATRQAFGDG